MHWLASTTHYIAGEPRAVRTQLLNKWLRSHRASSLDCVTVTMHWRWRRGSKCSIIMASLRSGCVAMCATMRWLAAAHPAEHRNAHQYALDVLYLPGLSGFARKSLFAGNGVPCGRFAYGVVRMSTT
uniref:Uncharacterized protein n=1 Tax=Lotharella oceanica TaxID=641309 RepID=A0A7S2TXJ9_9EUKA